LNSLFFSQENITKIKSLSSDATIHLIGICGVAMGQLAVALKKLGYKVQGSDKEFYDPMRSILITNEIKTFNGFNTQNLENVDLVVIGNSVGKDNMEVIETANCSLSYTVFPQVLKELLVEDRLPIVVTGTHGKSTTSSIIATVINESYEGKGGFFIGAKSLHLKDSLQIGTSRYTAIEGDEYDSSFFIKSPKFHFYDPEILIITSLEFDHADIYNSLNDIIIEFEKLVQTRRENQPIIVCTDTNLLRELSQNWAQSGKLIYTYGILPNPSSSKHILIKRFEDNVSFTSNTIQIPDYEMRTEIYGTHNHLNLGAAYAALTLIGINQKTIADSLKNFSGLARRLECRYSLNTVLGAKILVIEDFAHHPTAVREAIKAVRDKFPEYKICSVFEPRSNTSRRKVFENDYLNSLALSDLIYIKEVKIRHNDKIDDLIDIKKLMLELNINNKKTKIISSLKDIANDVVNLQDKEKFLILIMSNGDIEGELKEFISKIK
jgi:UDP-N-acetylmuramate: L-alanyl-gamma-D-glutamyl-meso-diaminopimelate ligase